ncbi:MAG TPA: hypothetical protein VK524_03555, partial [Polyangiaceae bacterium]|nr:hypothetical protein [Polyangiaceae bacterium]
MHALSIVRQLISNKLVRYSAGLWSLPIDRPDAALPAALEGTLSTRVASLGDEARTLAECLSLQQEQPSLELCRLISGATTDQQLFVSLIELAQHDVLYADRGSFRFSSLALRDVLLSGMDASRLGRNHRRLGEAFAKYLDAQRPELQLEAGWHLIQGGDELRGADLIADVAKDGVLIRGVLANLYRAGHQLEAALLVYTRHGRSAYERLPLLSSLAQAGYYEDRIWADRYGDSALELL